MAIGSNARANHANSIAMGSGSQTLLYSAFAMV
ncbi:hypothetical protein [Escherichia coli]